MTRPSLDALPGRACSIAGALEAVGDRWALLVVREVSLGSHRFTDIARGTGATRDRLTARLNDLVDRGVLERRPCSTAPPRSGYHLTRSGRDLLPVLHALLRWGTAGSPTSRRCGCTTPRTATSTRSTWRGCA